MKSIEQTKINIKLEHPAHDFTRFFKILEEMGKIYSAPRYEILTFSRVRLIWERNNHHITIVYPLSNKGKPSFIVSGRTRIGPIDYENKYHFFKNVIEDALSFSVRFL